MGGEISLREGSERVQRTVGALVVAPVSWDCAYGVAERTGRRPENWSSQDPGGMIRYEPLRPVSFPALYVWYVPTCYQSGSAR